MERGLCRLREAVCVCDAIRVSEVLFCRNEEDFGDELEGKVVEGRHDGSRWEEEELGGGGGW